jgi:competence protein ComEC
MPRALLACLLALAACAPTTPVLLRKSAPPTGLPTTPLAADRLRVHVIDVGQGSATLLEFPCAAILVDTGGEDGPAFQSTPALVGYLDRFFAGRPDLGRKLAALVITHSHLDHTRGIEQVMASFAVERVVTNGLLASSGAEQQRWLQDEASARGLPLELVRAHGMPAGGITSAIIDPVQCADVDPTITALWGAVDPADVRGWDQESVEDMNNHSVVLRVDVGEASVLLLGDVEQAAIEALVAAHGPALDADVMLVAHHGSHHSTTIPLAQAVSPRLSLISMGPASRQAEYSAWQWGHPRKVAVRVLVDHTTGVRPPLTVPVALGMKRFVAQDLRRAIYATGWDGTIVVELHGDERPRVWTER